MTISQIAIEERSDQLLKESVKELYCQEVLEFLRQHPRTWFSQLAIVHALNSHRVCIEQALDYLTDGGVIKKYHKNNVFFYSLRTL